ncbi:DUF3990 domain-containing protein [Clostridium gasigenes]|uniref:DUF3990 domain-containing protein n=1 Tax=Clostridium gasigenes TaxID=94869 RepID=UPI001C0DFA24|nr:DUF3990 domain-containing protein [Clostridium gasigenes]MBU3107012.1 DUF3990 domain-containing protein [Clostridium gasigenes]
MIDQNNLFHGSNLIVEYPEIRLHKFTKDFSWGFYCTNSNIQAEKFTKKYKTNKVINVYSLSYIDDLNVKIFNEPDEEWLNFIANCRKGNLHDYDIVEGPLADDVIWDYVSDYIEGKISKAAFMEFAKFRKPTHQISFHTVKALTRLKFERSYIHND